MIDCNLTKERPVYSNKSEIVDIDNKTIADYLFNEINTTFNSVFPNRVVKTCRYFNDITIPLTDFPVLKVYKKNELDTVLISPYYYVDMTVNYILAYTEEKNIANISTLVAKEIRRLLKNASVEGLFQLDENTDIYIEYNTLVNNSNIIYNYTNVNFKILTID